MNPDFLIKIFSLWKSHIESLNPDIKNDLFIKARARNGWFTDDSLVLALKGLNNYLNAEKLEKWLSSMDISPPGDYKKKTGIVMAGNIPLVGIHDLLCVLAAGHHALVKLSSQDNVLLPFLIQILSEIEPEFSKNIDVVDKLEKPDAVIATGSDNSARYFKYYFRNIPHIIRKNRTSIGILNGNEGSEALFKLGTDILSYYGLGCRNVSKLFVPEGFDFDYFLQAIQSLVKVTDNQKYVNNFDYNKSIFLVNRTRFYDNGFLLLKESNYLVSPVSVLFYSSYKHIDELYETIRLSAERIQCITSEKGWFQDSIDFGKTQVPDLWDYSDKVDTMEFLTGV